MKDSTKSRKKSRRTGYQPVGPSLKESLNDDNHNVLQSAAPGCIVTFNLLQDETNEEDVYILKLVDHQISNEFEISLQSTVGKNLNKKHVGDVVPFTQNSIKFTITILNIEQPV